MIEVVGHDAGFLHGLLRGLSAPVELFRRTEIAPPRRAPDVDAMRSDWERIGNDFRTVVAREHGKAATSRAR